MGLGMVGVMGLQGLLWTPVSPEHTASTCTIAHKQSPKSSVDLQRSLQHPVQQCCSSAEGRAPMLQVIF